MILVYGRAVRFPFLADDSIQFPFVDAHKLSEIWRTSAGLDYYRPLAFTVWKLLGWAIGGHNKAVLHFFNLLLHVTNGLLVAWLAGRLWTDELPSRTWLRRYLAASLFLTFPFSYQSVSWIAAMMHPLMTLLVLASFGSYLNFIDSDRYAWLSLSLLLALLAPFAHEIAVVLAPMLLAYEILRPVHATSRWRSVRAALWFLPALVWLIVWRAVPTEHSGKLLGGLGSVELLPNVSYVAQAAAYPATWFSVPLLDLLPIGEFAVVALISFVALVIGMFIQGRREWRMTLFATYWLAAAMAPAVLFVPFQWMSASPRVLYLASAAIVWLWADLILGLAGWGRGRAGLRRMRPALAAGTALLALCQGATFIRTQTQMYVLAGSAIDGLAEVTRGTAQRGRDAAVINFPFWLAAPQKWYTLGEEGVLVLGVDGWLEKLTELYLGQPINITGVTFADIRQHVPYYSGLTGTGPNWTELVRTRAEIFVTVYAADAIDVEPAGVLAANPPQRQPLASFEGMIDLLDARATTDEDIARLTLTWQLRQGAPPDVTVFAHLVDDGGQLVGQIDGDSLAGTYPFWLWPVGLVVEDQRASVSGSGGAFRVGLYDRTTGERLAARTIDGQAWPDNAVIVEIVPADSGK